MTDPRQAAIDDAREKAEILADQICACANREQHRRDVKLGTNALLAARIDGMRDAAEIVDFDMHCRDMILARADELEAMAKEIKG